ncbi:MAG: restriction endonuclease subunit S [Candidatus Gracilibacteria bacterium]|nr:restriction endonuclease subunit S [Candidatus Gracilibacteria bacterium]
MKSNYKKLGDYIREVNIRNKDLQINNLIGVSMEKKFISSVANMVDVDISVYKIIEKGQFACKLMSVGRDEKLPIDLYRNEEKAIVSSAYYVFEVIDKSILLDEFLLMWLSRPENDRYIGYISGGDVRGGISWDVFCEIPIKIPDIIKQQEIVDEYNAIKNRISLNNSLIEKLEETAKSIYKEWFVDFEFPDENGKPYKSSGGEMEFCSELEKEVPKGWKVWRLNEIAIIKAGGDRPFLYSPEKTVDCSIPIYANGIINDGLYGFTNKANYPKNSITVSARGNIGYSVLRYEPFDAIVRLLVIMPKEEYFGIYIWQTIRKTDFDLSGSVQSQLTIPQISILKVLLPDLKVLKDYDNLLKIIYKNSYKKLKENENLGKMKDLILSKMASES